MKKEKLQNIGKGTWKVIGYLSKVYNFAIWSFIVFALLWGFGVYRSVVHLIDHFAILTLVFGIFKLAFLVATSTKN